MTDVVYELNNDKSWQAALLQPGELLLLNNRHADADSFLKAYHATGFKKWMTSKKNITVAAVTRISHPVLSAKKLRIKYGSKSITLQFTQPGQPEALAKEIATLKNWHGHTAPVSKWRAVSPLLPGLLLTPLAGWLMHGFATGRLHNNDESGRRKAIGMLLQKLAVFLGPELVLAICGGVLCIFLYLLMRRLNEQQEEFVYE